MIILGIKYYIRRRREYVEMKQCKSCNAPLDNGVKFCKYCGAPTVQENHAEQQPSAALESQSHSQPPQAEARKQKIFAFMKKPIFTICVLLLIGGGITAAVLLKKSPKELYLLSEYNMIQQSMTKVEEKYGDVLEFQEQTLEKPSQSELKISGGFSQASAEGDPDYEMVQELLSLSSIEANIKQDPSKQKNHYALALNVENEKVLDAELYQTKDQLGIKFPVLYEKFLYFNLNQFGELMRRDDPYYDGPETLEIPDLKIQDLKLTEEESEYLTEHYAKFLVESLKDENFQLKKGVNYEYKGEEMKLRAVTLTLTEKEVKALLNSFIDQLIQDDKLHNMILKRVQIVADAVAVTGEEESLDKKEMKEEMINSLKDIKEDLKFVDFPDGFTSTLLIDKSEQIIDRDMKFAVSIDGEQVNAVFTSKDVPYEVDKEWNEWKVEISPEEDGYENKLTLQFINDIQEEKENRTEDMQVLLELEEYGESEKLAFNMNSDFKGTGGKQEINREFELSSTAPSLDELNGVKGEIKWDSDINLKKGYSNNKVSFTIDDEENNGASYTFNLDSKKMLRDSLKFPDLTTDSNNGVNVVEASEEEMDTIIEEISIGVYELGIKYGLFPEDDYYYGSDEY